jgi:hypothetical protein
LHPGVFSLSAAQNWSTVTPWLHAWHEAVIPLQQNRSEHLAEFPGRTNASSTAQ